MKIKDGNGVESGLSGFTVSQLLAELGSRCWWFGAVGVVVDRDLGEATRIAHVSGDPHAVCGGFRVMERHVSASLAAEMGVRAAQEKGRGLTIAREVPE